FSFSIVCASFLQRTKRPCLFYLTIISRTAENATAAGKKAVDGREALCYNGRAAKSLFGKTLTGTKRQGPPFYRSAGPSVLSWSCCPRAASDKTERGIAVFMRRKNHMAPARIILIGFALLI
ncbi:hypothetical protein MCGFDL_MCGFDL_15325, partial [Dysosmobacter welbionis]